MAGGQPPSARIASVNMNLSLQVGLTEEEGESGGAIFYLVGAGHG
jgi:hypothetical protein